MADDDTTVGSRPNTPALAVINSAPPRGPLAEEASTAIRGYGLDLAAVVITQRMAFVHSLTGGQTVLEFEPDGKAADEIRRLFKLTCTQVNLPAFRARKTETSKKPEKRRSA
jgi:chromosome partitioning protein